MPNWVAKLVGKFLKSKVALKEDKDMDEKKKWYQSRTVWAGVVSVLLAAYASAAQSFGLPPVPEWIFGLLAGFGVYTRVNATAKIG